MIIIEVKNLSLPFSAPSEENDTRSISFDVEKGGIFSVLGRNGSGKSMLARHLNALLRAQKGSVSVCGLDASDEKNAEEIRKKCGMVFSHSRERFFTSCIVDELEFAFMCAGAEKADTEEKIRSCLEYVGMSGSLQRNWDKLSEYECLCVQISSVLAKEPEIIVFDDAATFITGEDREKYFALLKKLQNDEKTILIFTNSFDEAAVADRTLLLNKGCSAAYGNTREVLTDRATLEKAGIEIPFTLRVYYDLLDSDIRLEKPPLNMRELVDEICL